METKTEDELRQAVAIIASVLREVARGRAIPPEVTFDVQWIDVSTVEGRAWIPQINISATVAQIVDICRH